MARGNERRKLVDRLSAVPDWGPLEAMLATTYELDPSFLETDLLPAVLGLGAWDDRSWASRIALEKALAGLEAVSVLTDQRTYRGRPRSLHVEVIPATSAPGQLLHAKVLLLVHEHAVRFQVSSANLTEAGYRLNREVALPLVASEESPEVAAVVLSALQEMPGLLARWWSPGAERVRDLAEAKLTAWAGASPDGIEFVWGGGSVPLWSRFAASWLGPEPVRRISVVSPFWTAEGTNGPFTRLAGALGARGLLAPDAEAALFVEAEPAERGTFRPRLPALGAFDPAAIGLRMIASAVDPRPTDDGVGEDVLKTRRLHAKVVVLEGAEKALAYVGSANFTVPGWGAQGEPARAHLEAGVILELSPKAARVLLPPTTGTPVPIDASIALVTPPEKEAEAVIPTFMRSARLEQQDGEILRLVIEVDAASVHGTFRISGSGEGGRTLLEGAPGCAGEHRLALDGEQLRNLLMHQQVAVTWWAASKSANYPVNVDLDARAALPIGPGDGKPGEHLLLQYYQGRIAYEELFPPPPGYEEEAASIPVVVDEDRVDTSTIQSYQVREFVEALQGIRDDLNFARSGTAASMRLALFGSVSPLALARQIRDTALARRRSPTAAGFQLVELAACLFEETVREGASEVWVKCADEARQQLEQMLEQIVQLHGEHLGPETKFHRYARTMLRRRSSAEAR